MSDDRLAEIRGRSQTEIDWALSTLRDYADSYDSVTADTMREAYEVVRDEISRLSALEAERGRVVGAAEEADIFLRTVVEEGGFWPSDPSTKLYKAKLAIRAARRRLRRALRGEGGEDG